MLATFKATLSPMLVMFLCILFGFVLNKKKLLPENAATVLSKLETYIIVPCLVINNFMKYCTVESLKIHYKTVLYSILICLIAIGIATLLSRIFVKKGYLRNIYKYALTFGNFGFMGNAIVPAIIGEELLYNYLLFTLPLNIACYSWGFSVLVTETNEKPNPFKNLLSPIFISILIGALLGLLNITPYIPPFITTTVSNVSACMGPIAMILTGFVIGDYDVLKMLKNKKVYLASFFRLILLPALFVLILKVIGADNLTITFCLFAYATPLGLNTVVFPAAYGGDTNTGASMAMISHTLCIISIPIMYSLLTTII